MSSSLVETLRRGANAVWQLGLTELQLVQFARYAEMLVEWNATRLNLTRIVTPEGIAVKHFLDSLAVLKAVSVPNGARVVDVGTGAGLPGLALKIARPDLPLTLIDSTAKKLAFCRAVTEALGLEAVQILHTRAEEACRQPSLVEAFDVVTARAVAPLEKLLPWTAPLLCPGGLLLALKGAGVENELPAARTVARRFGVTLCPPIAVILPEAEELTVRQIVLGKRRFAA